MSISRVSSEVSYKEDRRSRRESKHGRSRNRTSKTYRTSKSNDSKY